MSGIHETVRSPFVSFTSKRTGKVASKSKAALPDESFPVSFAVSCTTKWTLPEWLSGFGAPPPLPPLLAPSSAFANFFASSIIFCFCCFMPAAHCRIFAISAAGGFSPVFLAVSMIAITSPRVTPFTGAFWSWVAYSWRRCCSVSVGGIPAAAFAMMIWTSRGTPSSCAASWAAPTATRTATAATRIRLRIMTPPPGPEEPTLGAGAGQRVSTPAPSSAKTAPPGENGKLGPEDPRHGWLRLHRARGRRPARRARRRRDRRGRPLEARVRRASRGEVRPAGPDRREGDARRLRRVRSLCALGGEDRRDRLLPPPPGDDPGRERQDLLLGLLRLRPAPLPEDRLHLVLHGLREGPEVPLRGEGPARDAGPPQRLRLLEALGRVVLPGLQGRVRPPLLDRAPLQRLRRERGAGRGGRRGARDPRPGEEDPRRPGPARDPGRRRADAVLHPRLGHSPGRPRRPRQREGGQRGLQHLLPGGAPRPRARGDDPRDHQGEGHAAQDQARPLLQARREAPRPERREGEARPRLRGSRQARGQAPPGDRLRERPCPWLEVTRSR